MTKNLKTRVARSFGVVLAALLLAGCPAEKSAPESAAMPDKSGKIVIRGSNTIGEELAPKLIGEFKKDHPAAKFDVDTKATGYGLAALRAGLCDIAGASREANKEEIQEAQKYHVQLNNYLFGYYSVAVTVNANNPVANLTKKQVRDIFAGAVKNWKDVGGPDAPIVLYIRDPISGTYLGFREIAMDNKAYAADPKLMTNYAGIVEAIAQDANGIGYSSIELAASSGVKSVSIDGVAPTVQSISAGKYPYARPLRFYTNKAKDSGQVHDFIQYVESPKGQQVLAQMGFVPQHP